jgi:catechol 2,3-dioxygenase-like lactoylglutathione lyase family enzyme
MPDGGRPGPGGWNRIHLLTDDLAAGVTRLRGAGLRFRSPGGSQILLEDPSGNMIELLQPANP